VFTFLEYERNEALIRKLNDDVSETLEDLPVIRATLASLKSKKLLRNLEGREVGRVPSSEDFQNVSGQTSFDADMDTFDLPEVSWLNFCKNRPL
jgi:hypothetical protein